MYFSRFYLITLFFDLYDADIPAQSNVNRILESCERTLVFDI